MSRLRETSNAVTYGHISRVDGDRRLFDLDTQEQFFNEICDRYSLSTFDLANDGPAKGPALNSTAMQAPPNIAEKALSDLRKLREGLIASNRTDPFAIHVFEQTVYYAIINDHMQSFLPAIRYLLTTLYSKPASAKLASDTIPLESSAKDSRYQNMCILYLLYLCSKDDLGEFQQERHTLEVEHNIADELVAALSRGNWIQWSKLYASGGGLEKVMLLKTRDRIHTIASACIGASYLQVEMSWLDSCCGDTWKARARNENWQVTRSSVIIKRSKSKA